MPWIRGGRLLLGFVVLHQQTRDGGGERASWAWSEVRIMSRAALSLPRGGQLEHAVGGSPELGERIGQISLALGGAVRGASSASRREGIGQVGARAVELLLPGLERVGLVAIEHVAHGDGPSR